MDDTPSWRPLVTGEAAEPIWEVVHEIAGRLARVDPFDPAICPVPAPDLAAELAIFFAYLAEDRDDEDLAEVAVGFLEQAVVSLQGGILAPALYGGYGGIGWALQHLDGRLVDLDEDGLDAVDESLASTLARSFGPQVYDLVGGWAGFAVYALERLPRPRARRCLEEIVSCLERSAEHDDTGTRWFTVPELQPELQREVTPQGCYNLGVAHGIPGVIGVLALIHQAGVCPDETGRLLDRAVPWLLAQEGRGGERFPSWIGKESENLPSRLAWCYGDLGLAVTLLLAGRHRGRPDWEREALRIARRATGLPVAVTKVQDGGLCHGSAGLLHLFNRLYQATGEEAMAEAARSWLRHTLGIRRPGQEIAGFPSRQAGDPGWAVDASMLGGACGVGLALLAAVSPIEPAWDRRLLASLPPAAPAREPRGGRHDG